MGQESILLVDDDTSFLEIAQLILKRKGFQVETVDTAKEAIAAVEERFYNVAVLDISLPDMPGTELLSVFMEKHPDILAIMLTGHSSVRNVVDSMNKGAYAYLEKPLDPELFLSVIDRGLEKQRLVFENRRLVEELERRSREMSVLLAVSQSVSKSLELQQILDSALEKVAETMKVEAGFLYLLENDRLEMKGCYGFPEEVARKMKEIGLGKDLLWEVSTGGEPAMVTNLSASNEAGSVFLKKLGFKSYACVPLASAGEKIGVMGVATCLEHEFSKRDVDLLAAIGREVSIAVHNARLYEDASSARALRELDTMRTELLANVSHELRTPLAAIKGFASALLQPDVSFDEQTTQEFLRTIESEADKLNMLIEQLLLMARLDAGTLEIRKDWHKVSEIVDSIRDRLLTLTSKHKLRIAVSGALPSILVDDLRIGQVITNLVDNAIKYSPENTEIAVRAQKQDGGVIISVADKGPGIPPELQEKIFERFYQRNSSPERPQGAGLGLSICRAIVEAHGGKIWVESRPGEGAKFSFFVPVNNN